MNTPLRSCCCAASFVMIACGVVAQNGWANEEADVKRGQRLFEQVWKPLPDAGEQSDGLGPLFNERSCIACHHLGGIGGAGPKANNVELLTADLSKNRKPSSNVPQRLVKLHPAFASDTSIVLHRFSTDDRYENFRQELLCLNRQAGRLAMRTQSREPIKTIRGDVATLWLAERNTTPLFGAAAIDSISPAEIAEAAAQQTLEDPNVQGRFSGRFGWRGQTNRLIDFVRGACAVELGLQVSTHAQAIDPLPGSKSVVSPSRRDLTDQDCNDLVAFVASLPAPRQILAADPQHAALDKNGENLLQSVGCTVCHRPQLGQVSGIYSDLLLHDMGGNLVDPTPAARSLARPTGAAYYGSGPAPSESPLVLAKRQREWKTPPLWGLRDSGPYLHDGRARTVEEAIAQHGGEAAGSVKRYSALPRPDRDRLVSFLMTLAAPEPSRLPQLVEADSRAKQQP